MQLIEDIKQFHKFLSVQVTVIGTLITGYIISNPDVVSAGLGSLVSPRFVPLVALVTNMAVILLARAIAQPKLQGASNADSKSESGKSTK